MKKEKRDIYQVAETILTLPYRYRLTEFISNRVFVVCLIIIYISVIAKVFFIDTGDIYQLAAIIESGVTCTQLVIRKLVITLNKPTYVKILADRRERFWPMNKCGETLAKEYKRQIWFATAFGKFLVAMGAITCAMVLLMPILDGSHQLPMLSWYPENSTLLFVVFYLLHVILMYEAIIYLIVFDVLFTLFCTDILMQFQLLNRSFQTIDFNRADRWRQLKKCIRHQELLCTMHSEINGIYGTYFIIQFLITTLTISVQFYVLSDGQSSLKYQVKSVFYTICMTFQVGVFCIPACDLNAESAKLPDAIYSSDWHLCEDLSLRKSLVLVLQKSQQVLNMNAHGFLIVNRNEFIQIFRTSFSVATLLTSL